MMRNRKLLALLLGPVIFIALSAEGSCGGEGVPGGAATGGPALKPKETDLIVKFEWEGRSKRPIYGIYYVPDYVQAAYPAVCPAGAHSFSWLGPSGATECRFHKYSYGKVHVSIWQTGAGTVGCGIGTGSLFTQWHEERSWKRIGEKLSCDYDNPRPGNA
jgi:hypothetical protein